MKTLLKNFWNDQSTCLAALAALGSATVAAAGILDSGGSVYLAVGAALGALGIGGGATHAVGSACRKG